MSWKRALRDAAIKAAVEVAVDAAKRGFGVAAERIAKRYVRDSEPDKAKADAEESEQ